MNRQLYQMGGLSSLYNNSGGQKPIYPRISDIESSLSNAEQRIGDPSLGSFGETSDGGFGSMGGELSPIQQAIQQGPLQIPSTLINPVRSGVDTSQLGSPRPGSYIDFGQLSSLFGGVGDPRLGAPDVANSLQQIMRSGAADGGLMNRKLYEQGTDIADLLKMQQQNATDALTEEQLQATLPIDLQAAYKQLIESGLSPEQARKAIGEQLKQLSRLDKDYSSYQPQLLEPGEEMGNVFISQPNPPGYAMGGMIGRQQYGLGSLVKSIGKAVKSIASSPIGKAALLYAGTAGLGSLAAGGGFGSLFNLGTYAPSMVGSNLLTGLTRGASALGLNAAGGSTPFLQKAAGSLTDPTTLIIGGSLLAGLFGSKEQAQEATRRNPEAVRQKLKDYLSYQYRNKSEQEINQMVENNMREYAADGGRMGYAFGSVDRGIMASPQIGQQMGMPTGMPRQNQQGTIELDYRDQGGFVPPIGVKERADDVPAMLSNNEFVFTADAVKKAGGGDVNKGAQRMYSLMKTLENGGTV